jgi:HlyD family secretion protein
MAMARDAASGVVETVAAPRVKPWFIAVSVPLIAATALAGCGPRQSVASRPAPPATPTVVAQQGTVQPAEVLPGTIAPFQNVAISNTLAEPASAVLVQEGQAVQRGEVLAVLATDDLRANLEALRKAYVQAQTHVAQMRYQGNLAILQGGDQVQSARAALQQAQATLAQAQADYARDKDLFNQGAIAQQTLQQQATVVTTDAKAVQSAEGTLASAIANQQVNGTTQSGLQAANIANAIAAAQSAEAQADQVRAQIAKATIISPVDGIVVNRNLNPGEYPGTRTLFILQHIAIVYAMLNAASGQTLRIPLGAAVQVSGQTLGTRTFQGRVVAVLDQVMPGSTNFTVKVEIPNPDHVLRSGMAVLGKITLPPVSGVAIPATAFVDDSRTSVVAMRAGRPQVVPVRQIATDGTTSIVSGLAPGERIIPNGQPPNAGGGATGN